MARAVKACGSESARSGWSKNVVTDLGVRMLLGGASAGFPSGFGVSCSCGSGNSAPSESDTQIQSFIAGVYNAISNSTTRNYTVSPYYVRHSWTWRFPLGAAAGNVSELCVVNSASTPVASSPVFSRALVRDQEGNPSTITVLSDEYLEVTYELTIYPASGISGSFSQSIDGVDTLFSYDAKPSNMSISDYGWASNGADYCPTVYGRATESTTHSQVYQYGGGLGPESGQPTGTTSNAMKFRSSISSTANYSGKYRDISYTASLDDANATFDCMRFAFNLGCYQMQISPAITKVNTKTYTITIRVTLDNTI